MLHVGCCWRVKRSGTIRLCISAQPLLLTRKRRMVIRRLLPQSLSRSTAAAAAAARKKKQVVFKSFESEKEAIGIWFRLQTENWIGFLFLPLSGFNPQGISPTSWDQHGRQSKQLTHTHTQTVCKLIACVMRTEKKWGSINISRVYTQGRNGALSWARNRRRNCLSLGIYCYNDDQNSFPRDYYDNFFSPSHTQTARSRS